MIQLALTILALHWMYTAEYSPLNYASEQRTDQVIWEGVKRWEEEEK